MSYFQVRKNLDIRSLLLKSFQELSRYECVTKRYTRRRNCFLLGSEHLNILRNYTIPLPWHEHYDLITAIPFHMCVFGTIGKAYFYTVLQLMLRMAP